MKKAISILLALGMVLTLAACGNKSTLIRGEEGKASDETTILSDIGEEGEASDETTTSFDIGEAIIITPEDLYHDSLSNAAKAMQNTYVMNCQVGTITPTYFAVETLGNIRVFLPIEELAKLNLHDKIGIIGKVTNVYQEQDQTPMGGYADIIEMGDAMIYYNEAWSTNE